MGKEGFGRKDHAWRTGCCCCVLDQSCPEAMLEAATAAGSPKTRAGGRYDSLAAGTSGSSALPERPNAPTAYRFGANRNLRFT